MWSISLLQNTWKSLRFEVVVIFSRKEMFNTLVFQYHSVGEPPFMGRAMFPTRIHYVIKFVSDLRQVGGFLRFLHQ
jgi:hypothetical protein